MGKELKRSDFQANELSLFLNKTGMSVDDAAEAIGDSPERLHRVLEGTEPLGQTAKLAILARLYNLPRVEKGD